MSFRCRMATQSYLVLSDKDMHYSEVGIIEVGTTYRIGTNEMQQVYFIEMTNEKGKVPKVRTKKEKCDPPISP